MELLLLILGALLILFGFIGSFLPVVPGLPISLLGILIMQWTIAPFSSAFIWGWAIAIVLFSVVDNFIPAWTSQKTGGTRYGFWGSLLGIIVGIGFPPIGFIIGPLIGAFLGEMMGAKVKSKPLRQLGARF